jgi:hypothetical protein
MMSLEWLDNFKSWKAQNMKIDVPDGEFTIEATTSTGRRVTFAFMPYRNGGPPQCVDIIDHNNPNTVHWNGEEHPTNDVLSLIPGGTGYDSRGLGWKQRPMITTLLIEDKT